MEEIAETPKDAAANAIIVTSSTIIKPEQHKQLIKILFNHYQIPTTRTVPEKGSLWLISRMSPVQFGLTFT